MKTITIVTLVLVIACQIEFLYLINQNVGLTDFLGRILVALHKHNIDLEGVEIEELDKDENDEDE